MVQRVLCFTNIQHIDVRNVLLIRDITANLLSVSCIVDNRNRVEFFENGCRIYDSEGVIITCADRENNLYRLRDTASVSFVASANVESLSDADIWHRRFAHVNQSDLVKMRNGAVHGV